MRPRSAKAGKGRAAEAKTGFVIREASSGSEEDGPAVQRPMKRLRRMSSPRPAEVAADLEDDLEDDTSEEEADEEFGERSCVCMLSCLQAVLEIDGFPSQLVHGLCCKVQGA